MSIAGALLLFPPYSEAGPLGAMRVNLVQGDVQVKIADTGEWVPASVNMSLVEGDELWVPEGSRAALQTTKGDYVRLDENTALQILRMDLDSYQFHLEEGRVYVLNRAPKRSVLQFDTPDASIRAFGNAGFRIDIPGGETDISVFRGSVQTENDDGTTTVRAGNMLAVGADGYAERSPVPPPDDWQRWNAQRDRIVLARGKSYGYLPEELRAYSSDFDGGGRWVNVPEYGYCWTPTVVVIADWAPYRHGNGCGGAETTSGSAMSPGDGPPTITAAGPSPPTSAGSGFRPRGEMSTGPPGTWAGCGRGTTWRGFPLPRGKRTTGTATTDGTARISRT